MTAAIKSIRIHPGIGLARMGDSDEFFIGPEAPGVVADPGNDGSYRDAGQRLKRQAQRYRVYAYDDKGAVIGELSAGSDLVQSMRWRVHVRNMKAANYAFQGAYLFDPDKLRNPGIQPGLPPAQRDQLIIDAGVQAIATGQKDPVVLKGSIFTGIEKGELPGELRYEGFVPKDISKPVQVTYKPAHDIELGQLRLDDAGRLLFVASPGKGDCVTTPRVALSNPSEYHDAPNGPRGGTDPLTNQFAYFNIPGWWDDTCGGEIDVTVTLKDGTVISTRDGVKAADDEGQRNPERGAWIITAPPKYAPHMMHVVSILDRIYEAFPESNPTQGKKTNFYRDIYPIFAKAVNYGWVSEEASGVAESTKNLAHGPKQPGNLLSPGYITALADPGDTMKPLRQRIYGFMRHASGPNSRLVDSLMPAPPQRPTSWKDPKFQVEVDEHKMPKLWGTGGKPAQNKQLGDNFPNQFLSLTDWQLRHMQAWADGDFEVGSLQDPVALDQLPLQDQPHALDAAAMEPTIGGGFHPGIEFPYLVIYREKFAAPFRVAGDIEPGALSAYMSSPWHGDFWSCNTAWWPTQRPDVVFQYDPKDQSRTHREWYRGYDEHGEPLSAEDGYDQMVYAWPRLGMVLPLKSADGSVVQDNGETVYVEQQRDPALDRPPAGAKPKAG